MPKNSNTIFTPDLKRTLKKLEASNRRMEIAAEEGRKYFRESLMVQHLLKSLKGRRKKELLELINK